MDLSYHLADLGKPKGKYEVSKKEKALTIKGFSLLSDGQAYGDLLSRRLTEIILWTRFLHSWWRYA